jgi:hypothetical protein
MLQEVADSGNQCWAGMEQGIQKQIGYQLGLFSLRTGQVYTGDTRVDSCPFDCHFKVHPPHLRSML